MKSKVPANPSSLEAMTFAQAQRRQLAELLLEVGPDAPTLCEGWTTRELAAHLYVRERSAKASLGLMVGKLSHLHDKAVEKQAQDPFEYTVKAWASGPAGIFKLVDKQANAAEHFVHLEDVRRASGEVVPREFSQVAQKQLYKILKQMAPILLRGSSKPVIFTPDLFLPITVGGKRGVVEQGDDVVRVVGEVGELLLWAFGRDAVKVDISGPVEHVSR